MTVTICHANSSNRKEIAVVSQIGSSCKRITFSSNRLFVEAGQREGIRDGAHCRHQCSTAAPGANRGRSPCITKNPPGIGGAVPPVAGGYVRQQEARLRLFLLPSRLSLSALELHQINL